MKSLTQLLWTTNNCSPLIVRLTLGIVLFAHGAQSLLGWFGGPGFHNTVFYLTSITHLHYVVAVSVILLQFIGAVLLLLGAMTRPIAVAIATMFIGMIVTVHIPFGFFMNWFGTQPGEGYEYHLLVIALALASVIDGAGMYSVDRMLTKKFSGQ